MIMEKIKYQTMGVEDSQRREHTVGQPELWEQQEVLELNPEKLVDQEQALLAKFRKARNLAKVLVLVTALSVTPDFVRSVSAQQIKEPPKIGERTREKEPKKEFYSLEFRDIVESSFEVAKEIRAVYISVINDGEPKLIVLSKDELMKNPVLNIDGYIANIMIFCKDELTDIKLNKEKAKKIEKYKGEEYISLEGSCIYPEELKTEKYGEVFVSQLIGGELTRDKAGRQFLKGGYFFGRNLRDVFYSGKPVSNLENNALVFKKGDKIYTIPIKQKKLEIFRKIDIDPKSSRDDLIFNYLGNNSDKFSEIEGLDEKLQAIAQGINNVENIADMDLVDHVNLIDYKVNNAFADQRESFIAFFSGYLQKKPLKEVKITAEHETLHKYVFKRGFTESVNVRKIFADLKGYTGQKRQSVIKGGEVPFDDFNENYENKTFFSFINESNFLGGEGGHSHGNIWEFCTSFFHSLMYLDRLEEKLELFTQSQKSDEKQKGGLSPEEKKIILDNYIVVLKTLIKEAENIPIIGRFYINREEKFLKDKLAQVMLIKRKYEQSSKASEDYF